MLPRSEIRINVILLAAGNSERMKSGKNKVLLSVGGLSCIARSAQAFSFCAGRMVVVCREKDLEEVRQEISVLSLPFPVQFTAGGATRQESVLHGLECLPAADRDIVLIHDGARCLVDRATIENVIDSVLLHGSGIASVPVTDTVKSVSPDGKIEKTIPRDTLRAMQTPQGFFVRELMEAHRHALSAGFTGTDDAAVMEFSCKPVYCSEGSRMNLKLTSQEDLQMAESYTRKDAACPFRVGHGYDVHRLTEGRKLILCGVEIPYEKGLLGHSDADVAVHALMDALLGAAALGDIGKWFPDTDPEYKNISSIRLLQSVMELIQGKGFRPVNVDLTIIAQRPRLQDYIPEMRRILSEKLSLEESLVSVKATTTERLGFEGRGEGISAQAVCLLTDSGSV